MVSKHALIAFSVGPKYRDDVWCDVVPMDAWHLLLSKPWQYDWKMTHDGCGKSYSFVYSSVKIVLVHNKLVEAPTATNTNLLSYASFGRELQDSSTAFVFLGKTITEGLETLEMPEIILPLLDEFQEVFSGNLPRWLPPLRDIQHQIELQPGSILTHRLHYWMSPREHEELRHQVEELLAKGISTRA
ncbi:uncharacterized protein LOC120271585 [Dioscorea cayenensis subsp. rotundata]|uniref:Uncharacterized protein LOC120271585 n=1 Tax=Dioscorea cayennensis subsp. rotundata TaxID=55577 RepID=A0AB40C4B6_DIOCR|nr:uncharacterized protein LOC120271585 [Dioscorea cayenensis subsp. rotundata]